MADEQEHFDSCELCGATIYPEHLEKHVAGEWEGKLYCHHCLAEKRESASGVVEAAEDEPIALAEDVKSKSGGRGATAIRMIGGTTGGMADSLAGAVVQKELRRSLLKRSPNATRCRTFHTKLTDAAFVYLNSQINEWADSEDDIEIKFATSTIGVVEGKHADPHLIITVFY